MTEGRSDLIDLELELKHETDKAILVNDGAKDIWLAKSLVEYERAPNSKKMYIVTLPEWLALEKGLV